MGWWHEAWSYGIFLTMHSEWTHNYHHFSSNLPPHNFTTLWILYCVSHNLHKTHWCGLSFRLAYSWPHSSPPFRAFPLINLLPLLANFELNSYCMNYRKSKFHIYWSTGNNKLSKSKRCLIVRVYVKNGVSYFFIVRVKLFTITSICFSWRMERIWCMHAQLNLAFFMRNVDI